MASDEDFEGWAILELMGHRRLAGQVRSTTLAGAPFVRIDVPSADGGSSATQFYSPSAIYCVTPTTEEVARRIAKHEQPAPVSRFELALPHRDREPEDDEEHEHDDFEGGES